MNTNPVLIERIKYYRKAFGMTQEEFAEEIGVEALHISNVERGKRGMSLDMLLQICERFDISMADLIPIIEPQSAKLKAKWIDEILETLESLDPSHVGFIKTMICSLKN